MLVSREEAIRFELITAAGAGTAIAKMFSVRVGSTDVFAFRGDPDDTKTEGIQMLEWTMLEDFIYWMGLINAFGALTSAIKVDFML